MTEEYANWSARGKAPATDESELRASLEEPQPRRREAALGLVDVAETGLDEKTVSALIASIQGADDSKTRQFAVEALGVARAGLSGIETALSDGDEWVRAEAVVAFSRTSQDATDRLITILHSDDSGWVRRNALIAVAKSGDGDEDLYVDLIKNDPHPAVREYACQYLRTGTDVKRNVRILAAVLAREPNAFVRLKAAESIGEFGTDRAEEALERFGVSDQSDDVRRTATRALARSRGVDPDSLDIEEPPAPGTGPDRLETPRANSTGDGRPVGQEQQSGAAGNPPVDREPDRTTKRSDEPT